MKFSSSDDEDESTDRLEVSRRSDKQRWRWCFNYLLICAPPSRQIIDNELIPVFHHRSVNQHVLLRPAGLSPRLSKDDCHKIWMINLWCDVWMSSAALSLALYMIEWMALLDLTGDWYRKRMSIVDSNPSMSLYLRFMLEQHTTTSSFDFMTSESSRRTALRTSFGPFEPPCALRDTSFSSATHPTWLFDWSVIILFLREMIFLTAENSSTSVNQTKKETSEKSEKFFGTNWNVEDDLF